MKKLLYIILPIIICVLIIISIIVPIKQNVLDQIISTSANLGILEGYDAYSGLLETNDLWISAPNFASIIDNKSSDINRASINLQLPYNNTNINLRLNYLPLQEYSRVKAFKYPKYSAYIDFSDFSDAKSVAAMTPVGTDFNNEKYILRIGTDSFAIGNPLGDNINGYYLLDFSMEDMKVKLLDVDYRTNGSFFDVSSDGKYLLIAGDDGINLLNLIDMSLTHYAYDIPISNKNVAGGVYLNKGIKDIVFLWKDNEHCNISVMNSSVLAQLSLDLTINTLSTVDVYNYLLLSEDKRGALISNADSEQLHYYDFFDMKTTATQIEKSEFDQFYDRMCVSIDRELIILNRYKYADSGITFINIAENTLKTISNHYRQTIYGYKSAEILGFFNNDQVIISVDNGDVNRLYCVDIDLLLNSKLISTEPLDSLISLSTSSCGKLTNRVQKAFPPIFDKTAGISDTNERTTGRCRTENASI